MISKSIYKVVFIAINMLVVPGVHANEKLSLDEQTLARDIKFDPLILSKVKATGYRVEALTGVSRTGNSQVLNGLSFNADEQQSHELVARLGAEVEALGYRVFIQELGYGYIPDRIAIIKSRDKFDILRTRKTHAYTANLNTEQIIDRLKDWDKRYGLKLIGAGYDWVKAGLVRTPDDVSRFSREMLEFCPDVLLFKSGTVAQLARDIKAERMIFLQWK
jgi:hypothetical protein